MGQEEIPVMNSRADEMEVRMCLAKKKKKYLEDLPKKMKRRLIHFKKGAYRNIPAVFV